MDTLYAPAERKGIEEVRESLRSANADLPYSTVLDLLPGISLILNEERQVLFANSSAITSLQLKPEDVIGARTGEILHCVHAREMPGGCGTSEACKVCGAVNAVLEAINMNKRSSRECHISTSTPAGNMAVDVLVTAVPIATPRGRFIIVTLDDISDSKRREVLERVFFHDLMNSLASLQACVTLLNNELGSMATDNDYFNRMASTTANLIDEVQQQQGILTMEKGELVADFKAVELVGLLKETVRHIEVASYAKNRIALSCEPEACLLSTDPILLRRVVGNMLKNALEASPPRSEVRIALSRERGRAKIEVFNAGVIPRESQPQIFQRSFSTKGRGRGIGTYSMKILTEDYLKGEIGFASDEDGGTRFWISLPE